MPEVTIHLAAGRSTEQKRGLLRDVTEAVVKNTGVLADLVTVQIIEAPPELKAKGGIPYSERAPHLTIRPVESD